MSWPILYGGSTLVDKFAIVLRNLANSCHNASLTTHTTFTCKVLTPPLTFQYDPGLSGAIMGTELRRYPRRHIPHRALTSKSHVNHSKLFQVVLQATSHHFTSYCTSSRRTSNDFKLTSYGTSNKFKPFQTMCSRPLKMLSGVTLQAPSSQF